MDNGIYQIRYPIRGGQPTAAVAVVDVVADGAADEDFERLLAAAFAARRPVLIAARIDAAPTVGTTQRDPVQIRKRFMRGIGARTT